MTSPEAAPKPRLTGLVEDASDPEFRYHVVDEDGVYWIAFVDESTPGRPVDWMRRAEQPKPEDLAITAGSAARQR